MANALEEITGGVPKAPRPPDPEDVLGPPPHAPTIGRRGSTGVSAGLQSLRRRPPSPPRITPPPSTESAAVPVKTKTVVKETAKEPKKKPEDEATAEDRNVLPDAEYLRDQYNARAALQQRRLERAQERAQAAMEARQRAREEAAAAKQARKDEAAAAKDTKRAQRETNRANKTAQSGFSPEIRAKRAQQYAEMKASLDALRRKPGESNP